MVGEDGPDVTIVTDAVLWADKDDTIPARVRMAVQVVIFI